MSIEAGCYNIDPRGDYREPTHKAWQQELGCIYMQEKPGTQHFNPKMEAPVSLELTLDAASLATDAQQVLAVRKPHDPNSRFPEPTPEGKQRMFQIQADAFNRMKETISSSSPQDVSTVLTLANKLLDKSGIQFVYNNEGFIDLQSPDGHIDVLARPRK